MTKLVTHQQKQREVIEKIEKEIDSNSLSFSTVKPVADFVNDPRICLTSVHFPHQTFTQQIHQLIDPLKKLDEEIYFYQDKSLHMTIKNLRVIADPPSFDEQVIKLAKTVFSQVIPRHHAFQAYYYRLMLFPNNLALIGTTDEELDKIILDLDKALIGEGIPDDKVCINDRYFFSNVTLCRFNRPASQQFRAKVEQISAAMKEFSYKIDSVSLVSGSATLNQLRKIETWPLG
ncbi:MAG: hypothetical protein ABII10_02260 [Candidatus Paceibacterota bacterium]